MFRCFFSGRAWLHPATPINPAMLILAKILVAPWVFLAMAPQVQQHMVHEILPDCPLGIILKKMFPKKGVFWDEIVELSHVLCQVLELEDV